MEWLSGLLVRFLDERLPLLSSRVDLHSNATLEDGQRYVDEHGLRAWLLLASGVELVVWLFGSLFMFLIALPTLYRRPVFHRNLMIITWYAAGAMALAMLCRMVLCLGALLEPRILAMPSFLVREPGWTLAEQVRCHCLCAMGGSMLCMLLERIAATVQVRNYEHRRLSTPVLVLILGTEFFASVVAGVMAYYSNATLLLLTVMGSLMIPFMTVVYLWLVWRNAAQLRACNRMQSSTYTLGLRFQLAENRRVLAIFRRAVHSMGPLLLVLLMCIGAALAQPDRDGDQLYGIFLTRSLLQPLFALIVDVFALACFTGTFVWRTESLRLLHLYRTALCCTCPMSRKRSVGASAQPSDRTAAKDQQQDGCRDSGAARAVDSLPNVGPLRNADGKQMHFPAAHEQAIYFGQLRSAWN